MRSFNPTYSDRIYDPRPLVATIGTTDDARKTAAEHFRIFAEDSATFRAMSGMMRGNRGVL